MTAVSSLSHRRKLARAESHIEDVEAALSRWFRNGYRTFEKPNRKGRFVLYAEQLKPLPDDLPLVVGDAFQCLRNSLDHIISALSKKNPAMTPQDEDTPAFPIYDGAVRDNAKPISFLDKAIRHDVRKLAPDPRRQPLNEDPLWLLNKMSNRDKHREITLVAVGSAVSSYTLTASPGTDYYADFGPQRLQPSAGPMALVEFSRSPGVQAEICHAAQVAFDQGVEVADREVAPTLWCFHEHIRDTVFECLERHL